MGQLLVWRHSPCRLGKMDSQSAKKRGYRLEDLADGDLSTATISNIERGVPRVRSEKIACLLKKLGLDKKEWFEGKTKGKRSGMKAVIFAAENLLKAGYPAEALMELEGYSGNKENDILKLRYDLIKGNALKQLGKLSEAEGYFHAAIRGYHETFLSPGGNEEAEAFCSLGELYGERQDWGQALLFTESGLDSYDPAKGNLRLFWTLRRNQARFLWKTGRAWEALNALQKEWKDIEELPYLDEVLIFYRLRARLHLVLGEFDHAFRFAWDGLHKAVAESQMIRIYELARTLAEGCIRLQKWDRAEGCIRLLFRLQQEEVPPDEQVKGCILTGKYYTFHGEHEKAATAFDPGGLQCAGITETVAFGFGPYCVGGLPLLKKGRGEGDLSLSGGAEVGSGNWRFEMGTENIFGFGKLLER